MKFYAVLAALLSLVLMPAIARAQNAPSAAPPKPLNSLSTLMRDWSASEAMDQHRAEDLTAYIKDQQAEQQQIATLKAQLAAAQKAKGAAAEKPSGTHR